MQLTRRYILLVLFFFVLPLMASRSHLPDENKKFPKPTGIKNMLFYIQRSMNTNTIIYELNISENGILNAEEPIKYYYINYANHGEIEPVSDIQKKYAYGIKIKLTNKEKQSYTFSFNSIKHREFYLIQSTTDKKFHAFCHINKELAVLNNVFIDMENNFIGFPSVYKIELFGKKVVNNVDISETFKPE